MPDTGRVLPFRSRERRYTSSLGEAEAAANRYLSNSTGEIAPGEKGWFTEPDFLFAIAKRLRECIETDPSDVFRHSTNFYGTVSASATGIGLFDERDYLVGELALSAAKSARLLGRLVESERWLDRSEAGFRHIVDPAPSLTRVAFERLALRFASGRYDEILDLLPSVCLSFEKLELQADVAKCRYLKAMTLKVLGRSAESIEILEELEREEGLQGNASLYGQVLVHVGDYYANHGEFERAASTYERALPVVLTGERPVAVAELKWAIGDAYRAQNAHLRALSSYRSAVGDYEELGSRSFAAQLHLVIADILLILSRPREAEWEILAALPVIEEERMVPEGFAAVALLRESVKQRKTDVGALRALSQQIRSRN